MIKIKFKTPRGLKNWINDIEKLNAYQRSAIKTAGDETATAMRVKIGNSKVRPQAGQPTTLENNIQVTHYQNGDIIGWGVGEIDVLNAKVKYWRAVNYGSSHLVGKRIWGHFSPGEPVPNRANEREGRIVHHSTGKEPFYPINITKPIPAMNYIESTVKFAKNKVNWIVKNLVPSRIFRR